MQKTAYEMRISDWSSDVCSSDLAQLGDAQLDIAGLGGQQAWAVTVAFGETILGTLIAASADVLDRFGLDHLLQHQLHGIADQIHAEIGSASCRESVCHYV